MNLKFFHIFLVFTLWKFCSGLSNLKIMDEFIFYPNGDNDHSEDDEQWEFFVVGKRVPWNEALASCPIYGNLKYSEINEDDVGKDLKTSSTLAVFNNTVRKWLALMLSESNYRYDGLWIGGQRMNSTNNWTWIDTGRNTDNLISDTLVRENYPSWYDLNHHRHSEKNCLVFDRIGHDVPSYIPENCELRKPFVCMRVGKRNNPAKIIENSRVFVNGQRYTLYKVIDQENEDDLKHEGVRKLNGGGIKWRDARLECIKRGQHLAMIFTNEAINLIADAMLKSRPSMESVWLGGWSMDGTAWTWISTGFTLPSKKSIVTSYPPWLEGHPLAPLKTDDFHKPQSRCLILDRHLCPEKIEPVFLDLDCEKNRPFLCQDAIPEREDQDDRIITVNNEKFMFSDEEMTWYQGLTYCQTKSGEIARIKNSQLLSTVLDKMSENSLDHIWIGGRTQKNEEKWEWFDTNGDRIEPNEIGNGISWCLETERNIGVVNSNEQKCLNLDREGHGLPLFYGLPCDSTKQKVLCHLLPSKDIHNSNSTRRNMNNRIPLIQNFSTILIERVQKFANYEHSSLFFIIDESLSILNAWFAEELKLVAAVIERLFPLSNEHQMGAMIFSEKPQIVLELNQTDPCYVIPFMANDLLKNRQVQLSTQSNKTTDLIEAAYVSADFILNTNLSKVMMIFITDGEHEAEDKDDKEITKAIEKLNNLKNYGHEILAVVVRQGQNASADYQMMEKLFMNSFQEEQNLFVVQDYKELMNITSIINQSIPQTDHAKNCNETKWDVPQDDELLSVLLHRKK